MIKTYFDRLREAVTPLDPKLHRIAPEEGPIKGLFAETLLTADSVVIPIQSVALEIPTLIRWLGARNLEELVERGTIEFTYSPNFLTYISTEFKKSTNLEAGPGLELFQNLGHKSKPIDPDSFYSNIKYALKEQTDLSDSEILYYSKLLRDKELKYDWKETQNISLDESIKDGAGLLGKQLGLSHAGDPNLGLLPQKLHVKFIRLAMANQALTASTALDCQEIISGPITQLVFDRKMQTQAKVFGSSLEGFRAIQEFENVPDIGTMVANEQLTITDILKLRNSRASQSFRSFLAENHGESSIGYIREYSAEISTELGRNDIVSKHQKFIIYSLINAATGLLPPEYSIPIGFSISVFDTYLSQYFRNGRALREHMTQIEERTRHLALGEAVTLKQS